MTSLLLFLQLLLAPIHAPELIQVQNLIVNRSLVLGHPMNESEAHILAEAALEERGTISIPVILAVIEIESRYDARAKSKKKCKGLMQLSWSTAKSVGDALGLAKIDLGDIRTNVKLGVTYLGELLEQYGDLKVALTIYNLGWQGFVRSGKKVSGYSKAVLKRAALLDKKQFYLQNIVDKGLGQE